MSAGLERQMPSRFIGHHRAHRGTVFEFGVDRIGRALEAVFERSTLSAWSAASHQPGRASASRTRLLQLKHRWLASVEAGAPSAKPQTH